MSEHWFNITTAAGNDPEHLEVRIYDEIGGWGIQASDLIDQLKDESITRLTLRINSPGGSVFDALAIYNYLRQAQDAGTIEVDAYIDGYAASAATVVALAADTVIIPENAQWMIHNPWTMSAGDADQLRKDADLLDSIGNQLAGIYAGRSGLEREEALALMRAETWMTGTEAVLAGFADELIEDIKIAAKWNLDKLPVALPQAEAEAAPASDEDEEAPEADQDEDEEAPVPDVTDDTGEVVSAVDVQSQPETSPDAAAVLALSEENEQFQRLITGQQTAIAEQNAELETLRAQLAEKDQQLDRLADKAQVLQSQLDLVAYQDVSAGDEPIQDKADAADARGSVIDEFNSITDPRAKNAYWKQHRKELIAAASA